MRSLIDRERCSEPAVGCHTFHWQATDWSECVTRQGSTQCGHHVGVQQRDIYCADSSGHRVPVKRYACTPNTGQYWWCIVQKLYFTAAGVYFARYLMSAGFQIKK